MILSIKPVFGKNLLKTGLLLLISFAVFAQKGKTLIYDNQIYEPYIKTPSSTLLTVQITYRQP
jgi:hypothetical protein